jgi:hypothetical protein
MKTNELEQQLSLAIKALREKAESHLEKKNQVKEFFKAMACFFKEDDDAEQWNAHPVYSNYLISSHGKVMNAQRGKELKSFNDGGTGYLQVVLSINGQKKQKKVHQLVAETFLTPTAEGLQVNHINEIKTDNRLTNLEYITPRANKQHSRKKDCYSQYTGVTYCKKKNRYKAQIYVNRKNIYLGYYDSPEEAYATYKAYCITNKIPYSDAQ